ncbi:hypothetical protein EBZ80_25285, partial [bacterium]|nr:hypothetical protein [bacterium]
TSYGTVQSFTTSQLGAPTTLAATGTTSTGFTANWNAVTGASGYRLDVVSGGASDLIISEYLEGSSNNKYIEIFNGTGLTVDLSDYEVRLFANGAVEGSPTNTQDLSTLAAGPTTLASGACLVLKNSSAGLTLPAGVTAYSSTVANYNGDDALGIWKKSTSTYVDIFGVIGSDPGSAWTTNGITTLDRTLRRKPSVTGGVTTNEDSLSTLGTQWDQFIIDTASGLGSHSLDSPATFLSSFQNADAGSNTSLNVTGASPSTQYSYVVRATSANSTSASSAVRTVTTKGTSSIAVNGGTTSLTYSGAAQGPTFTVTGSTGAVTYSYTGTGGTTYGPSATAPTNVGSYTVTATVATDANFDGATSLAIAFTISAASLPTVTFTAPASLIYNRTAKTYQASVTGPSGLTLTYTGRNSTTYNSTTAPTNVGDYTVTATTSDGNYSGSQATNFSITAKGISGSFTASNKEYDGNANASVTGRSLVGVETGDTVTLEGGTATFSDANVGTGKTVTLTGATLTGAATGNYTLSSVSTTTANITAASLSSGDITLTPAGDGSYTASGPAGSTFAIGYAGRTANGIATSYSSATAPMVPGYYTVTATATGNYSGSKSTDYFVAGPILANDTGASTYDLRKPQDNSMFFIDKAVVLANDKRIDSSGNVQTTGLDIDAGSLSAVTGSISFSSPFIVYTPTSA